MDTIEKAFLRGFVKTANRYDFNAAELECLLKHANAFHLAKGLLSGLLGVGEISLENIARRAGTGMRRTAAPAGAGYLGTKAVLNDVEKKDKGEKSSDKKEEK